MFDRDFFARLRRDKFLNPGVSKAKLSQAMVEILDRLPAGTKDLKNAVVARLGLVGAMTTTRDINAAWETAKRKAARDVSGKFLLDDRGVLHWDDGSVQIIDKKISAANFRKLNELAEAEGVNVDGMVSKLIKGYKRKRG